MPCQRFTWFGLTQRICMDDYQVSAPTGTSRACRRPGNAATAVAFRFIRGLSTRSLAVRVSSRRHIKGFEVTVDSPKSRGSHHPNRRSTGYWPTPRSGETTEFPRPWTPTTGRLRTQPCRSTRATTGSEDGQLRIGAATSKPERTPPSASLTANASKQEVGTQAVSGEPSNPGRWCREPWAASEITRPARGGLTQGPRGRLLAQDGRVVDTVGHRNPVATVRQGR
jgi:hypothetical protein